MDVTGTVVGADAEMGKWRRGMNKEGGKGDRRKRERRKVGEREEIETLDLELLKTIKKRGTGVVGQKVFHGWGVVGNPISPQWAEHHVGTGSGGSGLVVLGSHRCYSDLM